MRSSLRSIVLCSLLVASTHASGAFAQTSERRAIDPAKSSATFGVQHIFVERVTGSVPIASGEVELSPGSPIPLSFSAVLDPTRMDSGDRDRDASLESADYFDTKKFPTWTFASTKIVPTGPAAFRAEGTLTMHGVAQPETLDVSVRGDAAHPLYHALGHVDRRAFALKGTRLDPVIGNVADITLDVALKPATGGVSTK
jgi:polyisoprenoid-binding protein YceI